MTWLWWLVAGVVAFLLLFIAPLLGYFEQPFAPWWLQGNSGESLLTTNGSEGSAPLVGPAPAAVAPPVDTAPQAQGATAITTVLLQLIQPWLGSPYVFGGNGPAGRGVDCSGFTLRIYAQLGVSLPRTAQTQFNATARVSDPQPGDLVFFKATYDSPDFITHVGIYMGGGRMVSAVEPTLGWASLDTAYWRAHLAGYGRVRLPSPPTQA